MNNEFTPRLEKIESVLKNNLSNMPSAQWITQSFGNLPETMHVNLIDSLIMPCRNLLLLGGKRWRPLFMLLCGELACEKFCSAVDSENRAKILRRIYMLTPVIEFVHTASLIHDDIEDSADMRRGQVASHITYGLDTALNAGSWLYFQASACIHNDTIFFGKHAIALKLALHEALNMELRRLHLGQAADIAWHKNNDSVPGVTEYMAMTSLKTGTLASLAARLGMLAGGASEKDALKLAEIAAQIGVGFQILDDVKNLTSGNVGKKRGDDIVEGKKSLPLLYHIEQNPDDFQFLMDCFKRAKSEGIDSVAVEDAINCMTTSNAIEKAKNKGIDLIESSCCAMQSYFSDAQAVSLIERLFQNLITA
ncbi:MAG: polyprenyl synthetase family protein [Spirochaetales bacterium]